MLAAEDDRAWFRRTVAVFAGDLVPLEGRGLKVFRLLLSGSDGCDAVISEAGFEMRFGSQPERWHRYFPSTAPPVVSELFRRAGVAPSSTLRAQIGPGRIGSWSFDRRWVWVDASATTVSIQVRVPDGADPPDAAEPLPEPIPKPIIRRFVQPTPSVPCPHCAQMAQQYRQLQDGWLVCPACGRSFDHPPVIETAVPHPGGLDAQPSGTVS